MTRQRRGIGFPTIAEAIESANRLGFPYAVQEWTMEGHPSDYVVAHGQADGIGKTVYATIPTSKAAETELARRLRMAELFVEKFAHLTEDAICSELVQIRCEVMSLDTRAQNLELVLKYRKLLARRDRIVTPTQMERR